MIKAQTGSKRKVPLDQNGEPSSRNKSRAKVAQPRIPRGKKKLASSPKEQVQEDDLLIRFQNTVKKARKDVSDEAKGADVRSFELYADLFDLTAQRMSECTPSEISQDPFMLALFPPLILRDVPATLRDRVSTYVEDIEFLRFRLIKTGSPEFPGGFTTRLPGNIDIAHLLPAFRAFDFYCNHLADFTEVNGEDFKKAKRCMTRLAVLDRSFEGPIPGAALVGALKILFPDDNLETWQIDGPIDVDCVLSLSTQEGHLQPLILVSRGDIEWDAFLKNQTAYMNMLLVRRFWKNRREKGAPVFFIQVG
ncbi:hypothetical protein CVT26_009214, partial [Gymnopilus dilepis]